MSYGPVFFPQLGPARITTPFAPEGWDRAVLADQVMPGISRVTRGGIRLKIDHKNKNGADGANPTCHGLEPQGIELEVITFTDDDRERLAAVVAPLVPIAGRKPSPVSIDHPSLRVLGITAVLIIAVSPLVNLGKQKTRMTFDLLHWQPTTSRNATSTAKGAPVRKVNNVGPAAAAANPAPTQQPGFGLPPLSLKQ